MTNLIPRQHILPMLVVGIVGLLTGLWAREVILDDAVITYRVAENLAFGRGFVFNPGERVQVTTTPLYAMTLAVGTWLFGTAIRAALVVNLVLSTLIPMLAYDIGRRLSGWVTGFSGALLLITAPFMVMAFSMESYLYVALMLAAFDAYLGKRIRLTGVLIGLTAMIRGDGALLGACLLPYDLIAQRRLRWQLIVPSIGIPLLWYIIATLYYGAPFPSTLGAKVAQGESDWLPSFYEQFVLYLDQWIIDGGLVGFYLIPILFLLGVYVAIRRERLWLILLARDAIYATAFIALDVPATEWYYAPMLPGIALLSGRGLQLLTDTIAAQLPDTPLRWRSAFAGGTVITVLAIVWGLAYYPADQTIIANNPDWKAQVYPDSARWIAENTNASANFATIDIGHLGYWSKRHIIDVVGLAQPDVADAIADGDFGYAIRTYQPDMVLIGFTWIPEIQSQPWFQADYTPRHAFRFEAMDQPLLLFSRREGVKVQPEVVPLNMMTDINVNFTEQIELDRYHVTPAVASGDPLTLSLVWRSLTSQTQDYTVFVQLLDASGNIVAQRDRQPQNGHYSTSHWQPKETIIDAHTLIVPDTIEAGEYALVFGLYELTSGARLPVSGDGLQLQTNSITVPITVHRTE